MKLESLLKPRSIAVIGAGREPEKVGHRVYMNLMESGFQGDLYRINPKATEILGAECYPSVLEVPDDIGPAVIAVPARVALSVA